MGQTRRFNRLAITLRSALRDSAVGRIGCPGNAGLIAAIVGPPQRAPSELHVGGAAAHPAFRCFALIWINRQPLIGRNVLRRNVRLFKEMSHE
jgi:hypothetical protein